MDGGGDKPRVTISAQMKKGQNFFIKSGYQPVLESYRATPMLSVVQIKVKLNFIKHCSF